MVQGLIHALYPITLG